MRVFGRVVDQVEEVFFHLAIVMVVFMVVSVAVEVVLRYFFLKPIKWELEINEYLLVQITFLSSAWVLRREGHVVVDLVTSRVNTRTNALLYFISSSIGAVLCLVLAVFGAMTTLENFQKGTLVYWTNVNMPQYAVNAVIPLGCLLLSLQFVRRAVTNLTTFRAAKEGAQA